MAQVRPRELSYDKLPFKRGGNYDTHSTIDDGSFRKGEV